MIVLLNNHGHSDQRFNEYLLRAAQFYGERLVHRQLLRHIVVEIKFNKHLDVLGYTHVVKRNTRGKARELLIELHPYISGKEILKTLAHEFVHVKQYVYEELNDEQTIWCGKPFDSDGVDYFELPWEVEALGMEIGLWHHFATKEALWNVFADVHEPNAPIDPEPIGWKDEDKFSKAKGKTPSAVSEGSHSKNLSESHREGRKEHQHGSTRGGHTTFGSWLKNIFLSNRM